MRTGGERRPRRAVGKQRCAEPGEAGQGSLPVTEIKPAASQAEMFSDTIAHPPPRTCLDGGAAEHSPFLASVLPASLSSSAWGLASSESLLCKSEVRNLPLHSPAKLGNLRTSKDGVGAVDQTAEGCPGLGRGWGNGHPCRVKLAPENGLAYWGACGSRSLLRLCARRISPAKLSPRAPGGSDLPTQSAMLSTQPASGGPGAPDPRAAPAHPPPAAAPSAGSELSPCRLSFWAVLFPLLYQVAVEKPKLPLYLGCPSSPGRRLALMGLAMNN